MLNHLPEARGGGGEARAQLHLLLLRGRAEGVRVLRSHNSASSVKLDSSIQPSVPAACGDVHSQHEYLTRPEQSFIVSVREIFVHTLPTLG